nr:MAG TPA_asm: hypothetical protein [Caudoviricetes sp.]
MVRSWPILLITTRGPGLQGWTRCAGLSHATPSLRRPRCQRWLTTSCASPTVGPPPTRGGRSTLSSRGTGASRYPRGRCRSGPCPPRACPPTTRCPPCPPTCRPTRLLPDDSQTCSRRRRTPCASR